MKKTIIFDLDGTLLNTLDDITNCVNYTLNKLNLKPVDTLEVRGFLGNGAKVLIQKSLKKNAHLIVEALDIYLPYLEKNSMILTKPYPNILNILNKLKEKYNLAVVSNKHQNGVDKVINHYFPNIFDLVIGERDNLPKKPDPKPLLYAVEKLESTIEKSIFIGDSEVDLQTANNAKMDVIGVTWGFRDKNVLMNYNPKYLIDDPLKILEILGE
ncbi:HAD family hydrolase [Acholeplasma granularum]|uniref:HAD family hydrolase n=1 Tax=Acholeplasma granularum TaxID=264635 RepID=UPI00046FB93A|nr:HAD family hydrolase [Acholeplasma granularum]